MSRYQLIHDDCLRAMRLMPKHSVDLILCDLPYGTTQCKWDTCLPFNELWECYRHVAKASAAIILFSAQPFTSMLIASNPEQFRYEWIWEKGNATNFLNAKKQPLRAHENIAVFYSQQPTYNPQMTHGQPRRTAKRKTVNSECYGKALSLTEYDSTSRYPRDVIFFSSDKQISNYHPTQKPLALIEYLVRTYTNEGMTVLDNCMGGGTTGVACINTGRHFVGIELGTDSFSIASRRIAAAAVNYQERAA